MDMPSQVKFFCAKFQEKWHKIFFQKYFFIFCKILCLKSPMIHTSNSTPVPGPMVRLTMPQPPSLPVLFYLLKPLLPIQQPSSPMLLLSTDSEWLLSLLALTIKFNLI